MKLTIKEGSANYACSVVKIGDIFEIPGADRIKRTVVNGNNVVIGTDVKSGDLMLYFVAMTKLSHNYLYNNNLYDKPEMNFDTEAKGYISHKGRVRAIKLKGIISDGILMPLTSLNWNAALVWEKNNLKEGDEFTDINEVDICEKYIVPVRSGGGTGAQPKTKGPKMKEILVEGQLAFHHETAHLAKNTHKLNLDDHIVLTEKLHGSSSILAKIKGKRKLSWLEKIAKKLGVKVQETEYVGVWSSGKPRSQMPKGISSGWTTPNQSYYTSDIWKQTWEQHNNAIEPGITIYGEVVGHGVQGKYTYDSLIPEGQNTVMVVYRITRTNDEGHVDEFSWNQVEEYCEKYGLKTVPVIYKGTVNGWINIHDKGDLRGFIDALTREYLEQKCGYTRGDVWAEGICVRKEKPYEVFKLKSKNFVLGESEAQEKGETNIEDEQ